MLIMQILLKIHRQLSLCRLRILSGDLLKWGLPTSVFFMKKRRKKCSFVSSAFTMDAR